MQLPRALARFNKRVTNRVQLRWAHLLPAYGILEHVGRTSGLAYRTPLNVFRAPGGFVVLIGYGTQSDWLRNVLAAGGGEVTYRRKRYVVSEPQLLADGAGRALLPPPMRMVSRVVHADNVLRLIATPKT
jgi:deazaflavin-dependent oxidoreductase (nitroreductase family)